MVMNNICLKAVFLSLLVLEPVIVFSCKSPGQNSIKNVPDIEKATINLVPSRFETLDQLPSETIKCETGDYFPMILTEPQDSIYEDPIFKTPEWNDRGKRPPNKNGELLRIDLCLDEKTEQAFLYQIITWQVTRDNPMPNISRITPLTRFQSSELYKAAFGQVNKMDLVFSWPKESEWMLNGFQVKSWCDDSKCYVSEAYGLADENSFTTLSGSIITVGEFQIGNPFAISSTECPLGYEKRQKSVKSGDIELKFDFCQMIYVRATIFIFLSVSITDKSPELSQYGNIEVVLKKESGFENGFDFKTSQHNWTDHMEIHLDHSDYEWKDGVLKVKYPDFEWKELAKCGHILLKNCPD